MKEEDKDLNYWKENAKDAYMTTPICVLRYITELEKAVKNNAVLPHVSGSLPTSKELEEMVVKIAYSQQGEEQSDDCYAKMGMLHEFISKYVNGNDL